MTEAQDSESQLSEILPIIKDPGVTSPPPMDQFKPWHLPRKHHVRHAQWGKSAEALIDLLPMDRNVIHYLCLPGEDLLDIEILANVCRTKGRRLKYLGFDTSAASGTSSVQRLSAEQQLKQSSAVEDTSEVIVDEFASIARNGSPGARKLRDLGSYDIVNLDMCDAFTTHDYAHNHDAVLNLLNHQINHRAYPWLLYLTTRSETDRLQQAELEAYDKRLQDNIQRSEEFRKCLSQILGIAETSGPDLVIETVKKVRKTNPFIAGRLLTIAVGKWLLGIMTKGHPWRVDLLSLYCYRTGMVAELRDKFANDPPNLFSLVFMLQKIPENKRDPSGLAESGRTEVQIDEVKLAHKLAKCVGANTVDLDLYFQNHQEEYGRLTAECERLLLNRYYSIEAYRAWIAKVPVIQVA